MLGQVIEVLNALGITSAISFMVLATAAIFVYRYFTDRS